MKVSFELTMPSVGSWDGKWTGANKKYFVIRSFKAKDGNRFIAHQLGSNNAYAFYYNFGDGWSAKVKAEIVDAAEARKRQKISAGFCGYEWMVNSIIRVGKITTKDTKILTS